MKSFLKYLLASILGVILASLILFFISMGIIGAIVASQDKPVNVKPHSMLMLKLDRPIVDRKPSLPFPELKIGKLGVDNSIGLNDLLSNIKKAEGDSNIAGIYLELSLLQTGVATVEEIRNALLDFKKSGKFIISYSDFYTQSAYYLASVSDKVFMNPEGFFNFDGLSVEVLFYKKALEKLDIDPQIIRHGKFKSAVEPFMNEKMSEENRLQLQTYVGSIWQHILNQTSGQRKLSVEKMNSLADNMVMGNAREVYGNKLIDSILYKDQVMDILTELTQVKSPRKLSFVSHNQYLKVPKQKSQKGLAKNKIAIIYASGDIISGEGEADNIGSESLAKTIREAREDSSVRAIVFRVNSGGGSALASEVIWRELNLTRGVKPIVASMGDYAASGGYYILTAADTIVASPSTLTGSIGVFGMLFNAKDFFNSKLGVSADVVKTNAHSDFGSVFRPLDQTERDIMQRMVDNIYETFISHVAEGRKMNKEAVDKIGEGRIWSGASAKNIGLVDVMGGMNQAVELAAKMAGIDHYRIVELPKLKEPIEQLMDELYGDASSRIMQRELGAEYKYYRQLREVLNSEGLMARLPFEIKIE